MIGCAYSPAATNDWTDRVPLIADALAALRLSQLCSMAREATDRRCVNAALAPASGTVGWP